MGIFRSDSGLCVTCGLLTEQGKALTTRRDAKVMRSRIENYSDSGGVLGSSKTRFELKTASIIESDAMI